MEVAAFVLSCVSIAISIIFGIITIVQNRKLHNENKNLSCKPNLVSTLLWDKKIVGQIVKKEYAIDSYNVWESKYTPYYKDGDIHIFEDNNVQSKPIFTIFIENSGFGAAKSIKITNLQYINDNLTVKNINCCENVASNIAPSEKIAKKIFCFVPSELFDKIHITLEFVDINNVKYTKEYKYIDSKLNKNLIEY